MFRFTPARVAAVSAQTSAQYSRSRCRSWRSEMRARKTYLFFIGFPQLTEFYTRSARKDPWILYIMCLLMIRGNGPAAILESSLYLFDVSHNLHYPKTRFTFFAVKEDDIMIEQLCIHLKSGQSDDWIDGILTACNSEETWGGDREYLQAKIYWIYNKFYTKTKIGQILRIQRFLSSGNPDISSILYGFQSSSPTGSCLGS